MSKKVLKIAVPVIASLAAGPIGGALGVTSGLSTTALGAGLGAAGGALTGGGLKGALTGAVTGGLGSGLTGLLGGASPAGALSNASGGVGTVVNAALKTAPATSGSLGGVISNLSQYAQPIGNALSGMQASSASDKMKKQLLAAQGKSEAVFDPYRATGEDATNTLSQRLQAGFNPGDLTQDPGYKFNLEQGQQAIDRASSARGNIFSGAALKEASGYAQGLADNTYNNAYQRWLQQNSQLGDVSGRGLSAANSLSGVYDNQGNINANNTMAKNNIMTGTLSSALRGSTGIVGYRADGTPVYQGDPDEKDV